ncbi:MAG: hypothetical protein FD153_1076 [Rhodospirillaceae bacterium]|nr:MAG: hypothetical protein FD153_1076 [Rhodospirillaceae bacterium]
MTTPLIGLVRVRRPCSLRIAVFLDHGRLQFLGDGLTATAEDRRDILRSTFVFETPDAPLCLREAIVKIKTDELGNEGAGRDPLALGNGNRSKGYRSFSMAEARILLLPGTTISSPMSSPTVRKARRFYMMRPTRLRHSCNSIRIGRATTHPTSTANRITPITLTKK